MRSNAAALRSFGENLQAPAGLEAAAENLRAAVGATAVAPGTAAETIIHGSLQHIQAADALRIACTESGQGVQPRFPSYVGVHLFPEMPEPERQAAVNGLIGGLCAAHDANGTAPLPVRAHLLFRSLQGLWACSDPQCTSAVGRSAPTPVGRLLYTPAFVCQCGSRVLELLYCEACGEIFLGGYRRPGANPNEWYLSPDHPDLEASPEIASFDRDYVRYAVFWPADNGMQPVTQQWGQDTVQREWQPAFLVPAEARVALGTDAQARRGFLYGVPAMHGPNSEIFDPPPQGLPESASRAYPSRCPRCDTNWARRDIGSPVRTQRTGFQKLAQVLSDVLLREVGPENPSGRKLVVFSDSRQDAAKLSAGMRFAHYRDSVRQALAVALDSSRCMVLLPSSHN